jgi:transposase
MRITYPKAIQESEEELSRLEQSLRGQKTGDRVRMLRLLKSGAVKSLKDCAPMVGYSVIQLTRWWERYRAEGLRGMLKQHKPAGKASRLTPEAWTGLLQAMRAGHIATMQDARNYLEREWGIIPNCVLILQHHLARYTRYERASQAPSLLETCNVATSLRSHPMF